MKYIILGFGHDLDLRNNTCGVAVLVGSKKNYGFIIPNIPIEDYTEDVVYFDSRNEADEFIKSKQIDFATSWAID